MRRRTDRLSVAALAVSLLVAAVVGFFGLPALLDVNRLSRENAELSQRIVVEARERRDQSCMKDEREHLGDVQRLRRTYEYLRGLPKSEWGTSLTVAVVRQVPELERQARDDIAPAFCDDPGFGLPEPDPVLPPPQDFGHLLKRP